MFKRLQQAIGKKCTTFGEQITKTKTELAHSSTQSTKLMLSGPSPEDHSIDFNSPTG